MRDAFGQMRRQASKPRWAGLSVLRGQLGPGPCPGTEATGESLVEDGPQAVDVAADVGPETRGDHLRGDVIVGARHPAIAAESISWLRRAKPRSKRVTWPSGETKILLGFTSPCIPTGRVEGVERLGHLGDHPKGDRQIERRRIG